MVVDFSLTVILEFVRKNAQKRREIEKVELMKKNDELHEKEKANNRGLKISDRDRKRNEHNNRGNYKTHEKRSHHPPQHNIQQPRKCK